MDDLLKELVLTPGVPGREHRIRDTIEKHVKPLVDEVSTDAMGNLICVREPRPSGSGKTSKKKTSSKRKSSPPKNVMLAAHMDQIGFIIRHVDDKGWCRVNPVGGFDMRNLFARSAMVCASSGEDLPAVMNPAIKPVHVSTEEEKKKVPEITEFFLDLCLDAETVKKKVKVGDMAVLTAPYDDTVGNAITSQCLDNRVGCWAVITALKHLKSHNCRIHAVFTVQEEVGLRGAGPAAFGVEPDIGFSCDTTACCDTPGVPEDQQITRFGEGISLKIMDGSTISDLSLLEDIEAVGDKHKIPHQRSAMHRAGQDGAMLQRSRAGVRTVIWACPVRYIHTVVETVHRDDLDSYHRLLTAWLAQA